jgi:cytidylate kinase
MSLSKAISVAIDGPAGAGKSSVSKRLAQETKFELLDTGAMYRAYAWLDLSNNYGEKLAENIAKHVIDFDMSNGSMRVICDEKEITSEIRSKEVTAHVSLVAANAAVREIAVRHQRAFIEHELMEGKSVILEGRDIGTVVLPNATLKFFLTASPEQRAKRRAAEVGGDVVEIASAIAKRDQVDSSREVSPLVQADDAILIDASNMSIEEVVLSMKQSIEKLR